MPFSFLSYPLDLLGTAGTNHITNETRAFVTAADRHFVPAAGPFYASSMIIRHGTTNAVLFPNTHYKLLHTHLEGTLASGKTVVAVVHIVDTSIPSISMDYRAIGGSFAETASVIAQNLQDNPPIGKTVWGQIIGQPPQYAPAEHLHNADEIYGLGDVVAALEHLRMAILQNDAMAIDAIYQYINVRLSNENYVTQDQLVNSVGGSAKIRVYTTAATLRAVTDVSTHQDYLYVLVGEGSANDKHGRLYYWDPACELLEDASLNVVKPDNVSSAVAGRFVSILRVEGDLASEITTRQSAVSALQTSLSNEITARYNADTVLTNAITALQSDLLAKASTAALAAEISARQNADTALSNSITSAVNTLTGLVNQEATNRANADTTLQNNINSEATARQNGDQNLQNQIDALSGAAGGFATTTQLNTEITDRQNAISAEATARQNTDTALADAIVDQAMNLTAESVARANADAALQGQITNHVVPTPSTGGLFLQSTGNTPGSYDWLPFNVNNLRAVDAAYLHDGFELVWANDTLQLFPRNGGLIWVNGNLYQIPTNGITCAWFDLGYASWVNRCDTNGWVRKQLLVGVTEDGVGGLTLGLYEPYEAANGTGRPYYSLKDPSLSYYTGIDALPLHKRFCLHPSTKTPILYRYVSSNGLKPEITCVGSIKLAYHGGYFPGYHNDGSSGINNPYASFAALPYIWPHGNFVHSLNSSHVQEFRYDPRTAGRFMNFWYGTGRTYGDTIADFLFKQRTPVDTTRYTPDSTFTSQIGDSYGATTYCLFGVASAYDSPFTLDYNVRLVMQTNTGDQTLFGTVADAYHYHAPYESYIGSGAYIDPGSGSGYWDWLGGEGAPEYIRANWRNMPNDLADYHHFTPMLNLHNAGVHFHGSDVVNTHNDIGQCLVDIFLFANSAGHGAPTSDIKLADCDIRLWRANQNWRRD